MELYHAQGTLPRSNCTVTAFAITSAGKGQALSLHARSARLVGASPMTVEPKLIQWRLSLDTFLTGTVHV